MTEQRNQRRPDMTRTITPVTRYPSAHLNEDYLPHVTEECGEVLQAIGKIQRFGVEHFWASEGRPNFEALGLEIGDLLEVIDRLDIDPEIIERGRARKRERLKTYGPETWRPAPVDGGAE